MASRRALKTLNKLLADTPFQAKFAPHSGFNI